MASRVDLSQCDREPIHLLGGVQPHGALLAWPEGGTALALASANAPALLGAPAGPGAPLSALLPHGAPQGPGVHVVQVGGRAFDALVHASDGHVVLELEPEGGADARATATGLADLDAALAELTRARGLEALLGAAAASTRRLIGYDRVMVYRFDADWNGEVVAEARAPDVDSFLGLHYPASDIPAQARALYTRYPLRAIADARAPAVPLLPAHVPGLGRPLDLSAAALRAVSGVHLEYLHNMGVRASLSLSLVRDGRLWGLVACHHRAPRPVSFRLRGALEVLARLLSLQLDAELRAHASAERARRAGLLAGLLAHVPEGTLPGPEHAPALLALADAEGGALLLGGPPHRYGATPAPDALAAAAAWLDARGAPAVFHTDRWAAQDGRPPPLGDVAGVLAVRLEPGRPHWMLWLRPAWPRSVTWAGNPDKAATPAPDGRLHPRASFEAWRQTLADRSRPWTEVDAAAAGDVRVALVGVVLRQARALASLSEQLRVSNEELDHFASTVSHDLKEPLRGIEHYARFVDEDAGAALPPESRGHLAQVVGLARRARQQLDDLYAYSRVGHVDLAITDVDLEAVLADVLVQVGPRLREAGVEVRRSGRLPTVRCDAVRVGAVWLNLVSNAAKYNDRPDGRWVDIGFTPPPPGAGSGGSPYVFHVADNGIGIPARFQETVFEPYRRLHPPEAFGGGTGMGLAIARRIVRRHGGRLWVQSTPGEGSTFYFTLSPEAEP